MQKQIRDRTKIALWLCAGMLLVCLLALGYYLSPVLRPAEPNGAAFGMVLIDIADEKTADSYHVEDCGVYVLAVQDQSAAAAAGVSAGDLLLRVNASPVRSTGEFSAMHEEFVHGEQVKMDFQRGNDQNAYAVTLEWNEDVQE